MKQFKLSNGEVRNAYKFKDLSDKAKHIVLCDQVEFEIEIRFLAETIYHDHKESLIETIEINKYLFDEDGKMLPIIYHIKNNDIVKIIYNNKHEVIEGIDY